MRHQPHALCSVLPRLCKRHASACRECPSIPAALVRCYTAERMSRPHMHVYVSASVLQVCLSVMGGMCRGRGYGLRDKTHDGHREGLSHGSNAGPPSLVAEVMSQPEYRERMHSGCVCSTTKLPEISHCERDLLQHGLPQLQPWRHGSPFT